MIDNKLFELINSMTGVEKRECSNFLKSPYFNQRADVLQLWQEQIATGKAKTQKNSAISSGERHVQSMLLQQIELFLSQRAAEQLPLLSDLHLAPVYRQKELHKHLTHVFRRAGERLAKMPLDNEYYYYAYRLAWEQYVSVESQARTRENNLSEVNSLLDHYIIGSKLRLACLMESHRAVYKIEYDTTFLPLLLQYLENSDLRQNPVIALYWHCYKALTDGAESDFRAFRQELEKQDAALPQHERRTFLLLAINYCIRRLNSGESRYMSEALDLYKVGLETAVIFENGYLGRFAFKNIAALALHLENFDWTEDFIHRYIGYLEEKYRPAYRQYNMARLYFTRKDYRMAMPLLAQVDESDLLLNLDSRVMLLKMYFEMNEWEALDALIASFKIQLLRKKKVIGYHQTHYQNMLRYVHKLTRLNPNDKKAVAVLRDEIMADNGVIERDWLLKML